MTNDTRVSRRNFLAGTGGLVAAAAMPSALAQSAPFLITGSTDTLLTKGKAQRVVICGGGWGGLNAAKQLRQLAPQLEVVVLERNPAFFSCPMSNKWLVDQVDTNFLMFDYLKVSEKYGYRFIQTEILAVERDRKRVVTSAGSVDYDYLILSPGIRYNYETWFGNDRRAAEATRARFPAAYVPNAEHFRLKQAIQDFKGGEIVMTLPPPPQRCPPSPYERACLLAWHLKTKKIKGHITILDHKDGIRPIGLGFKQAFEELYKDQITYVPNAQMKEVDPFSKNIKTAAGDFKFDHAILMAPHQAGDLAWKAGVIGKNAEGKPTGWAGVDPLFLNLKEDRDVYVIGDAVGIVSPQFLFYPKAGHVANRHAKIVAKYITERAAGREPSHILPDNLCYMWVSADPQEAINVQFDYRIGDFQDQGKVILQTQIDDNERRVELISEDFRWFGFMREDMFG
jgi:NADH dehydrogenase FAD-containing subunit